MLKLLKDHTICFLKTINQDFLGVKMNCFNFFTVWSLNFIEEIISFWVESLILLEDHF